ncbi:AT-hook motif nuclear-localized protein 17 [Neltuma alba]|uniref:AT-hook motif nuclear-localized protein 17 n=1 Tax=Neltuma alba TaxID=207710 RepID=UPI0010A3A5FC|nr:AT-hook motif nuclear-localized protein 17 [Prosopis alba]
MKGEYVEQQAKADPPSMFSKLHHHPFPHHPFQLSRESQTSEEDDNRSASAGATPNHPQKPMSREPSSAADGSSIEVVRRPRGRPPGSKNKPKPPVIITRDPEPTMSSFILEVPGGTDVVEAIARFCRRKNTGLCVLTGSGTVANVTLRQPSTTPGATVTFHGRFDILSISATFLANQQSGALPAVPNSFTISLAGPQGQIVGGLVAGSLLAAGTVFVVAASFNNPSYHRLPAEEDVRNSVSGGGGDGQSPPISGGGGESGHAPGDSCGMSMYSCQLPSDVIWAPTARPPPPY